MKSKIFEMLEVIHQENYAQNKENDVTAEISLNDEAEIMRVVLRLSCDYFIPQHSEEYRKSAYNYAKAHTTQSIIGFLYGGVAKELSDLIFYLESGQIDKSETIEKLMKIISEIS